MAKYILKRILYMALILLAVTTVTFFLLHAIPGAPITKMVQDLPEETRQAYLRTYGFDRPVFQQYLLYMKQLLTGDLGQSLRYPGRKVAEIVANYSPVSALVGGIALAIGVTLGLACGVLAALKADLWPDRAVMVLALLGTTIPTFVIASVLQYALSVTWRVFPTTGYEGPRYLVLPVLCMCVGPLATYPLRQDDVRACMCRLRAFHNLNLTVEHTFDLFGQIEFYERLRGRASIYEDYGPTKERVLNLRPWLERHARPFILTHIDAVPDNFLFLPGEEGPRLIDWEYAGMQDPDVDIAMFCIYSVYTRRQVDSVIDCYYPEGCEAAIRRKIYGYMAAGGLLWSNWCEYKGALGVEFGPYAGRQYAYAKEYSRIWEAMK